ncbi:hypothetical protein [Mycolicibacterium palauense]|uniref:hypothetical protein n=1 Tax=Mycolicibacterium palauense TaxID=2034511 RepID=UPI000BFEEFFA|nr:hypothetical protein [Mycolicibacterium palauense]
MVFISSDRLVNITEARNGFSVLLGDAREGRVWHIVKGSEVVAHLVPPTARIIDQDALLMAMATALLRGEAEALSREGVGSNAGADTGRLFVWVWRTDVRLFHGLLSQFGELLSASAGRPYGVWEVFGVLRGAMRDAGLGDSELAAAERSSHRAAVDRADPV